MSEETETVQTGLDEDGKWKPSPIEVTHPENVDPDAIRLFFEPAWRLRMTIEGDRSYLRIKTVRAAPLTQPEGYVSFLDAKDEEICLVKNLREIRSEYHPIIQSQLHERYLTSRIRRVRDLRNEYGVSYWDVETDRGSREFVVKNVAENAQWLSDARLMILDVDGNRFEIEDLGSLDRQSLAFIHMVL